MGTFSAFLSKVLAYVLAIIMLPTSGITYGLDYIPMGERTETTVYNIAGFETFLRTQGMTSDGEYIYFSSKTSIIKTFDDYRTVVKMNLSAIPDELSELGIKHIGGISYYNGKIYAGMEDSKVWKYPVIGVFDAETLQFEKYYVASQTEIVEGKEKLIVSRGMPWVAVNPETGILYCMDHSKDPKRILSFDVNNDMEPVTIVNLQAECRKIQGGEFYNGILYVATNDDNESIYRINTDTGSVELFTDRNLHGGEGEGMTFVERNGETYLSAMDLGTIFVNCFVREYRIEEDLK